MTAEENSHAALAPRWRALLEGFAERARAWIARASRGGTAARPRAGPGSSRAAAPVRGSGSSKATDRDPGARRASRGGTAKMQKRSPPGGRTGRRTSRSSTWGTTYLPAISGRPLARGRRRTADRRQPGRRRLPGLGRLADGRGQPPRCARRARRRPRRLPERLQQALLRRVPRRARAERGRSSRTPSTSTSSSRPCRRTGRSAARRRPDAGVPARARAGDVSPRARRAPDARLLVTGRLVSDPGRRSRDLGLADAVAFVGRYSQAAAPEIVRAPRPAPHEGERPVPHRRDRGDGERVPVAYPASGGTVELVGETGSASRTPTASSATSRPPRGARGRRVDRARRP